MLLASKANTTALSFLRAGKLLLLGFYYEVSHFVRFWTFSPFSSKTLTLMFGKPNKTSQDISECCFVFRRCDDKEDSEFADQALSQWLDLVSGLGADIQSFKVV